MKSLLVLLLLLVFAVSGCGSKEESLLPAKNPVTASNPSNDTQDDGSGDQSGGSNTPNNYEVLRNLPDNSPALNNSLEKNLNTFFSAFVVRDESIRYAFDSQVDYKNLNKLALNKDKRLLTLMALVERQFANSKVLDGKTKNFKMAFFINAYNYFSIRTILRGYLKSGQVINSIKDLSSGINDNIYDRTYSNFLLVAGKAQSLTGLVAELRILTGKSDPRIAFALNGGAAGFPPVLYEAYGENVLEEQLNFVTHFAFRLDRIFRIDPTNIWLGSLFGMAHFGEDIRTSAGSLKEFLEKFHKSHGRTIRGNIRIQKLNFDLNRLETARQTPVIDIQISPGSDDGSDPSGNGDVDNGGNGDVDNGGNGPGDVDVPAGNPCHNLSNVGGYTAIYSCAQVENGRVKTIKKSKFVVTKADICILQKNSAGNKKTADFKVVGSLVDIDPKEGAKKLVALDVSSTTKLKKTIKIEEEAPGLYTRIDLYHDKKIEADKVIDIRQKNKKGMTRRNERRAIISCKAI